MVSIEIIRQIACFRHWEAKDLEPIAQVAQLNMRNKDDIVVRAGDTAEAMYFLVSGQLIVSMCDQRGRPLQLAVLEGGACLGEMGVSQGQPRSADVVATQASVLLRIARPDFENLIRQNPAFAMTLLADMAKKLQDANQKLENRVALPVKDRLWLTLNTLSEAGRIQPPPKVTQLAAQIDASREMTSKALSQLVRERKVVKQTATEWCLQTG